MEKEIFDERYRLLKYKLLLGAAVIGFMYLMAEVMTKMYSAPEYIYYDKKTGTKRVVTEADVERANKAEYQRHIAVQKKAAGSVDDEIRRIIELQQRDRSK